MPALAAGASRSRGIGISETLGVKGLRRLLSEGVP
jgi:hypothetical protein